MVFNVSVGVIEAQRAWSYKAALLLVRRGADINAKVWCIAKGLKIEKMKYSRIPCFLIRGRG